MGSCAVRAHERWWGCRDRDEARLRQLDTSKIDGVMMVPARRAALEGAVFDAEGALSYVALEADSDLPVGDHGYVQG